MVFCFIFFFVILKGDIKIDKKKKLNKKIRISLLFEFFSIGYE